MVFMNWKPSCTRSMSANRLTFERDAHGVKLTCDNATLPTDGQNLVHRATTAFLQAAKITDGVRIHLEKKIPIAAGLGGGSGNAAATLLALNETFRSAARFEKVA